MEFLTGYLITKVQPLSVVDQPGLFVLGLLDVLLRIQEGLVAHCDVAAGVGGVREGVAVLPGGGGGRGASEREKGRNQNVVAVFCSSK